MTQNDRTETRDMIHDVLDGWQEATIQRENLIHQSLNSIDTRLAKINGTILEHNKAIANLKISDALHIAECPAMPKIESIEKNLAWYNFIKGNPKLMIIILTILVATMLISAFGAIKSIGTSKTSTEIRQSVDGVRYYLSPTRDAKPVPLDSDEVIKRMK